MKTKIMLALGLITFMSMAQAGERGGNGGGGVCIGKRCMTLSEAGLSLTVRYEGQQEPIKTPAVSLALYKEYLKVEDLIKSKIDIGNYQLSLRDKFFLQTFKKVFVYDNETLAKIKKEYARVLLESGVETPELEIYAVSTKDQTFLLPRFYELSLKSQALVMIHETLVRGLLAIKNGATLNQQDIPLSIDEIRKILRFDQAVYKLITNNDYSEVESIAQMLSYVPVSNRVNRPFWQYHNDFGRSGYGYRSLKGAMSAESDLKIIASGVAKAPNSIHRLSNELASGLFSSFEIYLPGKVNQSVLSLEHLELLEKLREEVPWFERFVRSRAVYLEFERLAGYQDFSDITSEDVDGLSAWGFQDELNYCIGRSESSLLFNPGKPALLVVCRGRLVAISKVTLRPDCGEGDQICIEDHNQ